MLEKKSKKTVIITIRTKSSKRNSTLAIKINIKLMVNLS